MEEAMYFFAPIAVAILAYLLDVRQARRYELEADGIKERVRAVELAHVSGFKDADLEIRLLQRTDEHHERRLDALEGQDSGLPKEHGDKMDARITEISRNVDNIAFAHTALSNEVKLLRGEEDE